ncbi:hypothetical protein [uncultured Ramlibacter sp.]|uniref:hypothetical protein n=1 Tax=uncultured Ramlibacter sp. TaxID=260755 RepID=UPI0026060847|nr:hypothetical protein [uncultured Ramlibacter sp.]
MAITVLSGADFDGIQHLQLFAADKREIGLGLEQFKLHPDVATHEVREVKSQYFSAALASYRPLPTGVRRS